MTVFITSNTIWMFHFLKKSGQIRKRRNFFNLIKYIYEKPTANTIFSIIESTFPLRLGTKQRCPLSLHLFNISLEVLARAIKQDKEVKSTEIRKEELKFYAQVM